MRIFKVAKMLCGLAIGQKINKVLTISEDDVQREENKNEAPVALHGQSCCARRHSKLISLP